MLKRNEFTEVSFEFAIPVEPPYTADLVTEPVTTPATDPVTETAAPTDLTEETTCAKTTGDAVTDKSIAPQTGDTMAFVACIVAADLVIAAVIAFRKCRHA